MTTANWYDAKMITPDSQRLVLVVIDGCVSTGNYFTNGRVWRVNGEYENGRVTHWAEFPQPPTLEETCINVVLNPNVSNPLGRISATPNTRGNLYKCGT